MASTIIKDSTILLTDSSNKSYILDANAVNGTVSLSAAGSGLNGNSTNPTISLNHQTGNIELTTTGSTVINSNDLSIFGNNSIRMLSSNGDINITGDTINLVGSVLVNGQPIGT